MSGHVEQLIRSMADEKEKNLRQRKAAGAGSSAAGAESGDRDTGVPSLKSRLYWLPVMVFSGFLLVNVIYPLDPGVSTVGIVRKEGEIVAPPEPLRQVASVSDVWFESAGVRCHGWLVLPKKALKNKSSAKPPVVVMAHGIGSTKDMGLYPYAVEFADAGIASFLIDYRGFGLSDGEPRHFVSGSKHTADIEAAVHAMSTNDKVDSDRVALWGTSFGGGHVVLAASRLGDKVRGVISQAPTLDGRANLAFNIQNRGLLSTLRLIFAGMIDFFRHSLLLSSAYIPFSALPGQLAVLAISQEELDQMRSKHPPMQTPPRPYTGGWENKTPARFLLTVGTHRPIAHASKATAPILYIQPSWDSVVPTELVDEALDANTHPRTRKVVIDGGHFKLYKESFAEAVPAMLSFLKAELA